MINVLFSNGKVQIDNICADRGYDASQRKNDFPQGHYSDFLQ